jgi:hypothetical protein
MVQKLESGKFGLLDIKSSPRRHCAAGKRQKRGAAVQKTYVSSAVLRCPFKEKMPIFFLFMSLNLSCGANSKILRTPCGHFLKRKPID